MDKDCGVVRDLLPLYVDGVCSEESRALVESHVSGCASCGAMLARLRDSACEDSLRTEARAVLAPRKWRNRAFATSCSLAAFVCVPACLIAAQGQERPLGWLALLAPSLLVVMAATMLPLRSRRYTGRWTLLGYTASLQLLLLACWVSTAEGAPFPSARADLFAAASGALYLLSVAVIVPWAIRELPLEGVFGKRRFLAALAWDGWFALLIAVALCLTMPAGSPALAIGIVCLPALTALTVWRMYTHLPIDRLARLGLCVTLAGNAAAWLERPLRRLCGASPDAAPWTQWLTAALLILSAAAGLILVSLGVLHAYRRSTKKPA